MRQHLTDPLRFFAAFLANPRQVGAVLPTSRTAVRGMLDLADVPGADLVVELGAGTGVQTGEILARLRPDARLVAVEIDPKLSALLAKRYAGDDRLQVVTDSAEKVTAFRPEMAVHGKFGEPCPVCGSLVQRIVYAENECNYCPRCQTGGKVLADRSLSRLLKDDWPRTVEELERSGDPAP